MSQCEAILAHLQAGHSLTPLDALRLFGCLAMHSRAAELRERGHNVTMTMRRENGKRFGEYRLERVGA